MSKNPKSLLGLFRTEKDWTQGWLARDINDKPAAYDEKTAVSFCLVGGLKRVYGPVGPAYDKARTRLEKIIGRRFGFNIIGFNDSRRRKFADIKRVIRLAKV